MCLKLNVNLLLLVEQMFYHWLTLMKEDNLNSLEYLSDRKRPMYNRCHPKLNNTKNKTSKSFLLNIYIENEDDRLIVDVQLQTKKNNIFRFYICYNKISTWHELVSRIIWQANKRNVSGFVKKKKKKRESKCAVGMNTIKEKNFSFSGAKKKKKFND